MFIQHKKKIVKISKPIICSSQDCIFGRENRHFYYQDKLHKHINSLTSRQHQHIWRSQISVFQKYYFYLVDLIDCGLDPQDPITWLEYFTSTSEINQQQIEKWFAEFILLIFEDQIKPIDCEIPSGEGIYWFTDFNDNLLYIGRSNNLSERIRVSFLQKLPYGVYNFNFTLADNLSNIFEAVVIDFYMPLLNNKKEDETLISDRRLYSKFILFFDEMLKSKNYQFTKLYNEEKLKQNLVDSFTE